MAGVTPERGLKARKTLFMNRLAARRAGLSRSATGFVYQPEPRSIGLFARGKQLVAGNFLFSGHLVEAPGQSPWDVTPPAPSFAAQAQGFGWLDDLAAVGDAAARARAQTWTQDWITRFGRGRGPGWTPDLTGRRLIRWINHALLLLNGRDKADSDAYFRALTRQVVFLAWRWKAAAPGLPRFEALTGLIYAGLALTGMESYVDPAAQALARECAREIDAQGGLPTRNPEELLEVFTLLSWAAQALGEAGRIVPPAHLAAIERIAPTLRALRHADGGLARFHGGGRGLEGRLDHALASAGVRAVPGHGLAMGFARLSGGRTTVIVDAADPPGGAAGGSAHASTLAFELTSGRRPLIVSCGSGAPFGPEWQRAGRATPSHSTLAVEGFSSSRLGPQDRLTDRAEVLAAHQTSGPAGHHLHLAHSGWTGTHGLIHGRDLLLSHDGRRLTGRDSLTAQSAPERKRFERVLARTRHEGVRFALRFHLHPDVDAAIDMGGTAISLALKSGEIWVFRHDGGAAMTLEPSVYLEKGRLRPRATHQIVLAATATDFEARIGWTLAKAQDTPLAIRDLDREDLPARP
jgi:uncharacterized heparinase superfamily protein